ncbi:calcium/sodium antiporter [Poseidonocella sedimentorum]|uniref:Cation:H+ antiporter n=1 Tax=Poseidonocella sedimentorum TaxID=871652 RepID=A0A1I6CN26_9RHOB|nr:calcium/sodium antiporter [Poseidonocella sedimentorum]SFQ94543.1 cation:H+ antiporter [Poseidonocella sedimentorum]
MEWVYAGLGLVILLLAGDALVRGAVNLSLRLGVPALIVSLTVVAFGTSAPELLIAIQAILDDAPGIALGNVVGSNIANVLLVLGIPALLTVMHTSECNTRSNFIYMIVGTLLFMGFAATGTLLWWHGLVMLAALGFVLWRAALSARNHAPEEVDEDLEGLDPDMSMAAVIFFLVIGLIGLPLGASLLVDSSIVIARRFHVPDEIIGLTLVAVGTSLPELATTVMAALRKQADVAIGNVIGSNMFNLLAIIGVATFVGPIPVHHEFFDFDIWVMLASSLLLIPFVFMGRNIGRLWGCIFVLLYGAYIARLLM